MIITLLIYDFYQQNPVDQKKQEGKERYVTNVTIEAYFISYFVK